MAHIDYYFATISPFTYLAGGRLEEIAQTHGASVTYKPLDIMALFARTGGVPPGQRHENRQQYRLIEMERAAKKLGVAMKMKPAHFPTNQAPSAYAIIAAQAAGGGDIGALVASILQACWEGDLDVAEDDVIGDCLEAAGFDRSLTMSGMMAGAQVYEANLEEAVTAGVFGAPFYITDSGQRFWGHDRLDDLDAHLAGRL